jgi:NAD(P)H-nitrite reductase large subunit
VAAIQPNAADQARIAALNMAGQAARMSGVLAINVLDSMGMISSSFGEWQGVAGGEGVERADEVRGRYISLQFDGDVLVGATAIGLTDHVGALRGLIQAKTRLGAWKERLLETPTRFVEAFIACQRPNS